MWDVVQKHNAIYLDEQRPPPFSSMDLESRMAVERANHVHDKVLMNASIARKLTLQKLSLYLREYDQGSFTLCIPSIIKPLDNCGRIKMMSIEL